MLLRASLSAAVIITGAIGSSPPAHADDEQFLTDLQAAGFYNDDGNRAQIALGHQVCAQIAAGKSAPQATRDLWLNGSMDQDGATEFVGIAVRDLCPQTGA